MNRPDPARSLCARLLPALLLLGATTAARSQSPVPPPPPPAPAPAPAPYPVPVPATSPGPAQEKDPATGAFRAPAIPIEARIGTVLQSPRYRPNGRLGPEILVEGAEDALRLGFRTFKIAIHAAVADPRWRFYGLSATELAGVRDEADLARLDVFRRVFDMPFRTYFITADSVGAGQVSDSIAVPGEKGKPRPVDRPLSAQAKEAIYRQHHDLAAHLLRAYQRTGKVFILQDPEMDWRLLPYADESLDPSPVAVENAFEYCRLRQKAVDDARLASTAEGVYVYNLVEVNLVSKAMSGRPAMANLVLPRLQCDLVGYSSYDTITQGNGSFARAVAYLRATARPSFAFGRNQVAITEIGIAERNQPGDVGKTLDSLLIARTLGVPWINHWAFYDNEATRTVNGASTPVFDATESDCAGFWVRKPDGEFGRLFLGYRPYLKPPIGPEPGDSEGYVRRAYRLILDREPDPPGLALDVRQVDEAPWDRERVVAALLTSPEYRARTSDSSAAFVVDAYRALLGRDPEPAMAGLFLGRDYSSDASRLAYVAGMTGSDESNRRYVAWLYRRYLRREPDPEGARDLLDLLNRGTPRAEILNRFVASTQGR